MTMSKQRTLRPSDFKQVQLLEQTAQVRLTALGLLLFADDEGRGLADGRLLKSDLYTLDESVTVETMIEHLLVLEEIGWLTLYRVGRREYFQITPARWARVDSPKASEMPSPPDPVRTPSGSGADPIAVEGEGRAGEGAERAEGEGPPGSDPDEPSPFCSKHRHVPTEQPCGPCGSARMRHQLWVRQQRAAATTD